MATDPPLPSGYSFADDQQDKSTPPLPSGYSFADNAPPRDTVGDFYKGEKQRVADTSINRPFQSPSADSLKKLQPGSYNPADAAVEQTSGADLALRSNSPTPTTIGDQVKSFAGGSRLAAVARRPLSQPDTRVGGDAVQEVQTLTGAPAPGTPAYKRNDQGIAQVQAEDADAESGLAQAVGNTGKDLYEGASKTVGQTGEDFDRKKFVQGVSQLVSGGSKVAIALSAPELMELGAAASAGDVAAQASIIKILAAAEAGNVASDVSGKVADHFQLAPETKELIQTVAFFLPTIAGVMANKAGAKGAIGVTPEGDPGMGFATKSGKTYIGAKGTPEAFNVNARVAGREFNINIPRNPVTVTANDMLTSGIETMKASQAADAAAAAIVKGASPQQAVQPKGPTPPTGMDQGELSPQIVKDMTSVIFTASPADRPQMVMEAHENLAKWIAQTGRITGPDGQIQIAKNPEQAQQLAAKIINAAVADHDTAINDAAQAAQKQQEAQQKEAEKAATTKNENGLTPEDQQYARAKTIIEASDTPQQAMNQLQRNLRIGPSAANALIARHQAEQVPTVGDKAEPVVEETKKTVDLQLEALKAGTIKAVMLPEGSKYTPKVPDGMKKIEVKGPGGGTYIYDPTKLRAATIKEAAKAGTHGDLLGHIQPKEETAGKPTVAVTASHPNGTEIQASEVDASKPELIQAQAQVLAERHPGANIGVSQVGDVVGARLNDVQPTEAKGESVSVKPEQAAGVPRVVAPAAPYKGGERIEGHDGKKTTVLTPSGKHEGRYRLVEAKHLIPSHDAKSFEPNSKYPQGVQERDYKKDDAKHRVITQAQNYDPAYTVNTNPDAVNGPPIVTPDGIVLGGNSRTMSTQRAYADGAKGQEYKDALRKQAGDFGFTSEQVGKMDRPMLVREIDQPATTEDMERIGSALNKTMMGALTASEKAVSAGRKITLNTMDEISRLIDLTGPEASIREMMREHGMKVMQLLTETGALTEREAQGLHDNGELSEDGKNFIERALLGFVVDSAELMDAAPDSVLSKLDQSLGAIAALTSQDDEYDLLASLRGAIEQQAEIAKRKTNIETFQKQVGLMSTRDENPVIDALARLLSEKPSIVRKSLRGFAGDAKDSRLGQGGMFGGGGGPAKAFNEWFGTTLSEKEYSDAVARGVSEEEPRTAAIVAGEGDRGVQEGRPERPEAEGKGSVDRAGSGSAKPAEGEAINAVLNSAPLAKLSDSEKKEAGSTKSLTQPTSGPKEANLEVKPTEGIEPAAKRETPKGETSEEAALAEHFTPGNVIKGAYWNTYDKVIKFTPDTKEKSWSVEVVDSDKDGNPTPGESPRTHSTKPDPRDVIVKRAEPSKSIRFKDNSGVERTGTIAHDGQLVTRIKGDDGKRYDVPKKNVLGPVKAGTAEKPLATDTTKAETQTHGRSDAPGNDDLAAAPAKQPAEVRKDGAGRNSDDLPEATGSDGGGGDGEPGTGGAGRPAPGGRKPVPQPDDSGAGAGAESDKPGLATPADAQKLVERNIRNSNNYRIDPKELADSTTMAAGGVIGRIQGNIRAIKLVKEIVAAGRNATKDEQEQLSRYVGWGQLANVFDSYRGETRKYYDELREILTPAEYNTARASVINAHYTAPDIIQGIWKLAQHLGVNGGTILEPSMGTGLFYGLMPKAVAGRSALIGVELDNITGAIAKLLYPDAQIAVKGYQDIVLPDNSLDFATGNVPFGDIKISDSRYKPSLSIHNYFFAKTLDKLKPGAGMVMITSAYGLDAKGNQPWRELMAKQADLVGALRLPSSAFKKNAGTEVVTDILVFRKRFAGEEAKLGWLEQSEVKPGITVNSYYADHPEHILGEQSLTGSMYRDKEYTVTLPREQLAARIDKAIESFPKKAFNPEMDAAHGARLAMLNERTLAPDNLKDGAYTVHEGKVVRSEKGILVPVAPQKTVHAQRIRGLIDIREAGKELIRRQIQSSDDDYVDKARTALNSTYDAFVKKYGYVGSPDNWKIFGDDPEYPLLASLEDYSGAAKATKAKGDMPAVAASPETASKSAMFSRRTAQPYEPLNKANFPQDVKAGLARILGATGKVDLPLMAELAGRSNSDVTAELRKEGLIYQDPFSGAFVTKDDYLSGNVRRKLDEATSAAELDSSFKPNVEALEKVQPEMLTIHDLANSAGGDGASGIKPGGAWIPPAAYEEFVKHLAGARTGYNTNVKVYRKHDQGKTWALRLSGISTTALDTTWAGGDVSGHDLFMLSMNQKLPTVRWKDADGKYHVDSDKTMAAREMQQKIANEFSNWATKHATWGDQLAAIYNREINNSVLREFDGAHLQFPGMTTEMGGKPFQLMPHQVNATWRIVQEGRAGIIHVVGGGKTFVGIAAGMEMRRMGISPKNIYVVPNNKVDDWQQDFQKLYPGSNVLATDPRNVGAADRQAFMSKIATGDYDGTIIAQSHFDAMNVSSQLEAKMIQRDLDEAREALEAEKSDGTRLSRKQIESRIQKLEEKLAKMLDIKQDNAIHFDQLGVTMMFVDEAQAYKNLYAYSHTSMPGLPTSGSQKSTLMKMKTEYLQSANKGRGVVFLTGTPVTNTLVELYNMTRYIAPDLLVAQGITTLDDWIAAYASPGTDVEFAADGLTMKAVTRLKRYSNLPELAKMLHSFGDIKMREDLPWLKVPEVTRHEEKVTINEAQAPLLESIINRSKALNNKQPFPLAKNDGTIAPDNWLWISSDARKISLDARLAEHTSPDSTTSKINAIASKVMQHWKTTMDKKGIQLVFAELTKNHTDLGRGATGPAFDFFKDLRQKLMEKGMPASEIVIVNDEMSQNDIDKMQIRANAGDARLLMGSTAKLGTGINIQKRLYAIHQSDQPWRPDGVEQSEGRMVRQGNSYDHVHIHRYISVPQTGKVMRRDDKGDMVESSPPVAYDVQLFEKLATKQSFINQVVTNNISLRSIEDPGGAVVLDFKSMMADATGNPDIFKKVEISHALTRALSVERSYQSNLTRMQWSLSAAKTEAGRAQEQIERTQKMAVAWELAKAGGKDSFSASVDGKQFDVRAKLEKYLEGRNPIASGEMELYGVPIRISSDDLTHKTRYEMAGGSYDMPDTKSGIIASVEYTLRNAGDNTFWKDRLAGLKSDIASFTSQLRAKNPDADKIEALRSDLAAINVKLGLNPDGSVMQKDDTGVAPADEDDEDDEIAPPKPRGGGPVLRSSLFGVDLLAEVGVKAAVAFYRSDLGPTLEKLGGGGKEAGLQIAHVLAPRAFANKDALDLMMKMKGEKEYSMTQIEGAFRGMEKMLDKLSQESQIDFIDRMQTGKPQQNPELQQVAFALQEVMNGQRREEQDAANLGRAKADRVTLSKKENYFPNKWDTRPGKEAADTEDDRIRSISRTRRPLEGSKGYMKKQSYTLKSGIEAGGVPAEYNAVRAMQTRIIDGKKFSTAKRMWFGLKDLGMRKFVGTGDKPPMDWVKINDRIASVYFPAESGEGLVHAGQWYAEPSAARLLNNYLSPDFFQSNALGKGIMAFKMATTSVELAVSPFHLVNEALESVASQIGLGMMHTINVGVGKGDGRAFLEGMTAIATAPAAPFTMARTGGSAIRAMNDLQKFMQTNRGKSFLNQFPDAPRMMRLLFHGGLTTGMPRDFRGGMLLGLKKALKEDNYVGAMIRAVPALSEAMMKPLFETLIPRYKVGYAMQALAQALSENAEKILNGDVTELELARKVVDATENNFGEMNFSNLFWNNTFKGAMQVTFRSATWQMTNWRSIVEGTAGQAKLLADPLKVIADDVRGRRKGKDRKAGDYIPKVDLNMSRQIGLFLLTAAMGAVIGKILSERWAWEHLEEDKAEGISTAGALALELMHPRSGKTDPYSGKPTRLTLPLGLRTYEHAYEDAGGYAKSTLSGFTSKAIDSINNKDFFGDYVYDPNGTAYRKMVDLFAYNMPQPITVSNLTAGAKSDDYSRFELGLMGVTKASRSMDLTKLEKHLEDVAKTKHIARTPEDRQEYQEKMQGIRDGTITGPEKHRALENARKPYLVRMFDKMSYIEAKNAYDHYATEAEKETLRGPLARKRSNALRTSPFSTRMLSANDN